MDMYIYIYIYMVSKEINLVQWPEEKGNTHHTGLVTRVCKATRETLIGPLYTAR